MAPVIGNLVGWSIGVGVIAVAYVVFMIFWKTKGLPRRTFNLHKQIAALVAAIVIAVWTFYKLF
jgi:hypothetical protein